jgi:hypothetical protein
MPEHTHTYIHSLLYRFTRRNCNYLQHSVLPRLLFTVTHSFLIWNSLRTTGRPAVDLGLLDPEHSFTETQFYCCVPFEVSVAYTTSCTGQICHSIYIPVTGCGDPLGCEPSKIPYFLNNRLTDGTEAHSLTCWLPFTTAPPPGSQPQGHSVAGGTRSSEKSNALPWESNLSPSSY